MSRKFSEPSLNPIPDLSLHISPPNSAPSSICSEGDSTFHLWRKEDQEGLKSHSDSSIGGASHHHQHHQADTELTLANPTCGLEAESPWRTTLSTRACAAAAAEEDHVSPHSSVAASAAAAAAGQRYMFQCSNSSQIKNINHGISVLDVSEGLKPIRGIPVYNSCPFPFPNPESFREIDPNKLCVYQMPFSSSSSSSSAAFRPNGFPRLNGISMEALRPQFGYQQQQPHQYGVGSTELCNGMIRSRFVPRLQTKRNMRAPRMRWTSSLHARFVHAVELLGGHESQSLLL